MWHGAKFIQMCIRFNRMTHHCHRMKLLGNKRTLKKIYIYKKNQAHAAYTDNQMCKKWCFFLCIRASDFYSLHAFLLVTWMVDSMTLTLYIDLLLALPSLTSRVGPLETSNTNRCQVLQYSLNACWSNAWLGVTASSFDNTLRPFLCIMGKSWEKSTISTIQELYQSL